MSDRELTPKEKIDTAMTVIYEFGQIDGGHHKTWVIDQVARYLMGKRYDKWVEDYENDGEYEWDRGIAP